MKRCRSQQGVRARVDHWPCTGAAEGLALGTSPSTRRTGCHHQLSCPKDEVHLCYAIVMPRLFNYFDRTASGVTRAHTPVRGKGVCRLNTCNFGLASNSSCDFVLRARLQLYGSSPKPVAMQALIVSTGHTSSCQQPFIETDDCWIAQQSLFWFIGLLLHSVAGMLKILHVGGRSSATDVINCCGRCC